MNIHGDDNGKKPAPSPEPPLPQQDDKNLGDDLVQAGEGENLTNDQQ